MPSIPTGCLLIDPLEFQQNHHKYWGKLYKPEDVKVSYLSYHMLIVAHSFFLDILAYPD